MKTEDKIAYGILVIGVCIAISLLLYINRTGRNPVPYSAVPSVTQPAPGSQTVVHSSFESVSARTGSTTPKPRSEPGMPARIAVIIFLLLGTVGSTYVLEKCPLHFRYRGTRLLGGAAIAAAHNAAHPPLASTVTAQSPLFIFSVIRAFLVAGGIQWLYGPIIQGTEDSFEGNWAFGGTHHIGTGFVVLLVGGAVMACELSAYTSVAKRYWKTLVSIVGPRRVPLNDPSIRVSLYVLLLLIVKSGAYFALRTFGIFAPVVPLATRPEETFSVGYAVFYCIAFAVYFNFVFGEFRTWDTDEKPAEEVACVRK